MTWGVKEMLLCGEWREGLGSGQWAVKRVNPSVSDFGYTIGYTIFEGLYHS